LAKKIIRRKKPQTPPSTGKAQDTQPASQPPSTPVKTWSEAQAEAALERKELFLKVYSEVLVIREACKITGVPHSTVIRWRMEDPEFDKKFKETQEAVADALEDIAFERAKHKSDILLMFLLNGLRPEKYKYRVEHGGKINFNISADILGEADRNAPGLKRA